MNKNLLILGAGQYGSIAKEVAEAMECFDKIDFLDDNDGNAIGRFCDFERYSAAYSYAIVAVGNPETRLRWIGKLEEACYTIPVLVHPRAYISPSAQIMKGCIIEPLAVVQANSTVAAGCLISSGAVVNHNCFIGDGCHLDSNATVKPRTVVAANSVIGSGVVVCENTFSNKMPEEYSFEVGV
ncbi:MAG: PglB [Clostridia bacterium]|nr:PglB [Clostridia bacterium]